MRIQKLLRTCHFTVLFSSIAAVAGCATNAADQTAVLTGRWVLETIDGKPIAAETEIFFEIRDSTISGYDGCNHFGGSLDDPSRLRKTQRACPSDQIPFPLELANPRAQLESGKVRGDVLELPMGDSTSAATFRRTD